MGCIAIWCSQNVTQIKPCALDTHFNLWNLKEKNAKTYDQFMDIGIRLKDKIKPGALKLFLPFKVEKKNISDIGELLKNENVIRAVFNEGFAVNINPEKKFFNVNSLDGRDSFDIYTLDINNDIEEKYFPYTYNPGSVLTIKTPAEPIEQDLYYRFRIKTDGALTFVNQESPPNSWLESAFYVDESIDFKVNERRNLDKSLLEAIRKDGGLALLHHTHLLIMRENKYDYVFANQHPATSRPLEKDIWCTYVKDYCCDNIVAYHWKQKTENGKSPFEDYDAYIRYKFWRSSWITTGVFLLLLLALGFEGSLLANIVNNILNDSLRPNIITAIGVPIFVGIIVFLAVKLYWRKQK